MTKTVSVSAVGITAKGGGADVEEEEEQACSDEDVTRRGCADLPMAHTLQRRPRAQAKVSRVGSPIAGWPSRDSRFASCLRSGTIGMLV
eukprot:6059629-Pyramimonas_sp.AAC.1